MKNLLALPNDKLEDYFRVPKHDFLSEFSPSYLTGERCFDSVSFLNWKDSVDGEYAGIKSLAILRNNEEALQTVRNLVDEKIPFQYPLFTKFFEAERDAIIERARSVNPQLMRAFNADHAAELGIMIRKELGIPLVVSVHNTARLTEAMKYADSLVCISKGVAQKVVGEYGINPDEIVLIPDGIDMDLFSPKSDSEVYDVVDKKYGQGNKILTIGRFSRQKNLERTLRAISLVNDEIGNVQHIHLGTDAPDRVDKIKGLASNLGLDNVSHFLGSIPKEQLPFYYSWADVFFFPSLWEGLGRVQVEALASGTPSVTSNFDPMTEVVKPKYNGLIVDPKNVDEMAWAVMKVLTDKDLKARLSENARHSVERYDINRVMQAHCDNYDNVLKRGLKK